LRTQCSSPQWSDELEFSTNSKKKKEIEIEIENEKNLVEPYRVVSHCFNSVLVAILGVEGTGGNGTVEDGTFDGLLRTGDSLVAHDLDTLAASRDREIHALFNNFLELSHHWEVLTVQEDAQLVRSEACFVAFSVRNGIACVGNEHSKGIMESKADPHHKHSKEAQERSAAAKTKTKQNKRNMRKKRQRTKRLTCKPFCHSSR
jgi:hypothetical protein